MVAEFIESLTAEMDRQVPQEAVQALGAESLASVAELRPGMTATLAFLNWVKRNNEQGYGLFGVAEYKRDDGGLYVDHHGPKVYLD